MTIAFPGYSGQAPSSVDSSLYTFLRFCNGEGPREVHIRLKRYQLVSPFFSPTPQLSPSYPRRIY